MITKKDGSNTLIFKYTMYGLHLIIVNIVNFKSVMPVAHGKIFCQKSFTKLFMKSFVKISCVVHGKTVRKMV